MISRIVRTDVGALSPTIAAGIGIASGATRTSWNTEIRPHVATSRFDIDGDGVPTAIDALIITRAALGLIGSAVTSGLAFRAAATRRTWPDIRNYLVNQCGMSPPP